MPLAPLNVEIPPSLASRVEEHDDDGELIQGVQVHVPLRSGMEFSRKGNPLIPIYTPVPGNARRKLPARKKSKK